jgi:hypothetical protein
VISTLSNVVFEHLPSNGESPVEPANEKEEDQPSVGEAEGGGDGGRGKEARKQWGQGEGPPVIELLQHKQLQTVTYAVDDGNTGIYVDLLKKLRERDCYFLLQLVKQELSSVSLKVLYPHQCP